VTSSGRPPVEPDFTPIKVLLVDVEKPLPAIGLDDDQTYGAVWLLVRLHGRPLGEVKLTAAEMPMSAAALQARVRLMWGSVIDEHLRIDETGEPDVAHQVPSNGWETCLFRQQSFPSVSVVIPTYRRPVDVVRCVDSILATGYPDLEVIVVDNAPGDARTAVAVAETYSGDGRVRYLAEWTAGASRARNQGVRHAHGEVVAFADDDIVVDANWIAALVNALTEHRDVDCVTGLVLPQSLETPIQLWFEEFGGFNRGYAQREFDLSEHRGDTLLYPYTAGAMGGLGNVAFRRSALQQPDAFDVLLGPGTPAFGAEDQDAFVSLLRTGHRLLYEPAALVYHRHRDNYGDLRWQVFTYGAGLSAALVHWAVKERAVALELGRRVAAGLPLILRGGNREKALQSASSSCPPVLRTLERLGYLYGPIAYARALISYRRIEGRPT
jgi:glycosyltransferase involved in cell wall biosynthesis